MHLIQITARLLPAMADELDFAMPQFLSECTTESKSPSLHIYLPAMTRGGCRFRTSTNLRVYIFHGAQCLISHLR